MTLLSRSALKKIAGKVKVPKYDQTALQPGIIHIGLGNFHRAHMAAYMDDLFSKEGDGEFEKNKKWGIVGAGIMSFDQTKRDLLEPQNWMQTLVERDGDSTNPRVLKSMMDFLPVNAEKIEQAMHDPNIKIVSLTVTEGGYFLNDGKFDPNHPQIVKDIQDPQNPDTVYGVICKAMKYRKDNGMKPFTIMSCDNIPHNGSVVKEVCLGLANAIDAELGTWMEQNVAFPNSMVDRITPGTTEEQIAYVKDEYGYDDKSPIFCEPFRQWVLEDKFSDGRPDLDQLDNVKFVEDVAPYEFMKIRILNGGHASLCYPSALLGLPYVHSAMEHPTVGPFLDTLERQEIIPTVGPVPDTNLTDYWKIIESRFSNPAIADTIRRICFGGSNNQPKFVIPVVGDNLKAGRSVDGHAIVSAAWCAYCMGQTEAGASIEANDPNWDLLSATATEAKNDPQAWLNMSQTYGSIGQDPIFSDAFSRALEKILMGGVEGAMKDYIEEGSGK